MAILAMVKMTAKCFVVTALGIGPAGGVNSGGSQLTKQSNRFSSGSNGVYVLTGQRFQQGFLTRTLKNIN